MVFGSNPAAVDFPDLLNNKFGRFPLGGSRLRQSTHYPPGKDVENSAVLPQITWKVSVRWGIEPFFYLLENIFIFTLGVADLLWFPF